MNNFERFGEVFKITMINMVLSLFAQFWSQFLIDFDIIPSNKSLEPLLQDYDVFCYLKTYNIPKNGKNIVKNCKNR